MTIEQVRVSIGLRWPDGRLRFAWAQDLCNQDHFVILVRAGRAGNAVYVCDAYGSRPNGGWTSASLLVRREDLDHNPPPAWLQQVLASTKAPLHIYDDILYPPTAEQRARAAVYGSDYPQTLGEERAQDRLVAYDFEFDTDTEGKVQ